MTPDQIRRSWDYDDTPRSVFPEPLAERLTRENKELRAIVEAAHGLADEWSTARHRHRTLSRAAGLNLGQQEAHGRESETFRRFENELRAVLDKHAGEQPDSGGLNCPVCGSGEFGDCVCGSACPSCERDLSYPGQPGHECYTRTPHCICDEPPVAREVVCALHPTAHLNKHAGGSHD